MRIIERAVELTKMCVKEHLDGEAFNCELEAHQFVITGLMHGEPVIFTGTVGGRFLPPDGGDAIQFTNEYAEIDGQGRAVVTLPDNCYPVSGAFGIVITLTSGDHSTVIYAATGFIGIGETPEIVDPGNVINVDAIEAYIDDCIAATASAQQAASFVNSIIAPTYSTGVSYAIGDYCTYEGSMYRATAATSGEFDPSDWEMVLVGGEFKRVDGEVSDLKSAFKDLQVNEKASLQSNESYYVNFIQGRIDSHSTGDIVTDTTRVISNDILNLIAIEKISITADSGYQFAVWTYTDNNESSFIRTTGWISTFEHDYLTNRNIRIFCRKSDDSVITVGEAYAHIHIKANYYPLYEDRVKASIENSMRDWMSEFVIPSYIGTYWTTPVTGYYATHLFRCVSGDRIIVSSAAANNTNIFVTLNKYGNIKKSVVGTGVSNAIVTDYTFDNNDVYFAIGYSGTAYTTGRVSVKYISQYKNAETIAANDIDISETIADFSDFTQIGGINTAVTPPNWNVIDSRIRTFRENPIHLNIGDEIFLSDYTSARLYVIWQNTSGTWNSYGWITTGTFKVTENGNYWFVLTNVPEATITDRLALTSLLRVKKRTGVIDYLNDILPIAQRTDWIVKSINHRGYSELAPENTLPAFTMSARLGWKYVETDVRFTSDNVPVLLHDETINRTARNADGSTISTTINISDITYEQALQYDFGIWWGSEFAGTKIPTLTEFLYLCKKLSLDVYLEIKDELSNHVEIVVKTVNRCGMRGHASYLAFSSSALVKVNAVDDYARIGLLRGSFAETDIDTLDSLKTSNNSVFVDIAQNVIDANVCDALADAGYPLEAYTPNGSTSINALDRYVTGVTSDYMIAGKMFFEENYK